LHLRRITLREQYSLISRCSQPAFSSRKLSLTMSPERCHFSPTSLPYMPRLICSALCSADRLRDIHQFKKLANHLCQSCCSASFVEHIASCNISHACLISAQLSHGLQHHQQRPPPQPRLHTLKSTRSVQRIFSCYLKHFIHPSLIQKDRSYGRHVTLILPIVKWSITPDCNV
jgi:hypothetical protein